MRLAMLPTESAAFQRPVRHTPDSDESALSRRRFLGGAAAAAATVVVGKAFWPTEAYGRTQTATGRNQSRGPSSETDPFRSHRRPVR